MSEHLLMDKYIKRIKARLHFLNKNWLAIICGETGSGKSYSALSLGDMIGHVHLVFNPRQFLELLNSDKVKKGHVIIFDEAGVGMSSREWYSVQNKLLGSVLQTFRNMNCAVIFTTPDLSFIDVQARKLFHSYLETNFLDYEEGLAYLMVYDIQVNSRYDKTYYKRPVINLEGKHYSVSELVLEKPRDSLVDYYETRKSAYTKKLNQNALASLLGKNAPRKPEINNNKIVEEIVMNKSKFLKRYNNREYIDTGMLRAKYPLSDRQAKVIKSLVERQIATSNTRTV